MAAFWYTTMFYRQIGMIRYIFAFALFSLTNWGLTLINCLLIWQWLGIIIFLAYMVIAVHVLPRFTTDIVFRRFFRNESRYIFRNLWYFVLGTCYFYYHPHHC